MRTQTHLSALAMLALAGCFSQANAAAPCPELSRLRGEAVEASNQVTGIPRPGRCEKYIRSSMAWYAIVQYANDHRDACEISSISLSEFETLHREAVNARDNICSGRPARPLRADIILR